MSSLRNEGGKTEMELPFTILLDFVRTASLTASGKGDLIFIKKF